MGRSALTVVKLAARGGRFEPALATARVRWVCGRFVSSSSPDELARYFSAAVDPSVELGPNYNVAPTSDVFVVVCQNHERLLQAFRWGLVPSWAEDLRVGARMINARLETVATRNAYRQAFQRRRCIVPADGFYEWTTVAGQARKQPWYIHRPEDEPYGFAGLWERWRPSGPTGPAGMAPAWTYTCTVITAAANPRMAQLHERMPVALAPQAWDAWLNPDLHDVAVVASLLRPTPAELVTFHPVSVEVNTAVNRGPQLIEEISWPPDAAAPDSGGTNPPGTGVARSR